MMPRESSRRSITTAIDFDRDLAGREARRRTQSGLALEHRYDALDRLIERRCSAYAAGAMPQIPGVTPTPTRLASQRRWQYDVAGRVTQIDDARWGSTTYKYDPAGRLLEATSHQLHEVFEHDAADTLTSWVLQLEPTRNSAAYQGKAQVGPGGRLLRKGTTEYQYDVRGRRISKQRRANDGTELLTRYDWDDRDKLRRITKPDGVVIDYEYDAFGRRIQKTKYDPRLGAPAVTFYVWDGEVLAPNI